jgi:hypothetical protein
MPVNSILQSNPEPSWETESPKRIHRTMFAGLDPESPTEERRPGNILFLHSCGAFT